MNYYILQFLLLIGFLVGMLNGLHQLSSSQTKIKPKSLLKYLLD